jgi:hypothetical protein
LLLAATQLGAESLVLLTQRGLPLRGALAHGLPVTRPDARARTPGRDVGRPDTGRQGSGERSRRMPGATTTPGGGRGGPGERAR